MDIRVFFKTTVENTAKAVVSALKKGLFSVEVKNLPKVTEISGKVNVLNLKEIEISYQKIREMFDDLKKNLPTTVKVENFPEFPEFPSFPEPEKFPDKIKTEVTNEITVKEFKQLVGLTANISKKLDSFPKKFPEFPTFPEFPKIPAPIVKVEGKDFPTEIEISNLETLISKNPKAYIPVRLTDGEDFYESMARSFGGAIIEPYSDNEGLPQKALVDKNRHIQVDVLTMPNFEVSNMEVNNFPTEYPLPTSQIETLLTETPPTDTTKLNPAYKIYKNANKYTVKIEEIIGATTYTTNIIPIDNDTVIVYTEEISSWT